MYISYCLIRHLGATGRLTPSEAGLCGKPETDQQVLPSRTGQFIVGDRGSQTEPFPQLIRKT